MKNYGLRIYTKSIQISVISNRIEFLRNDKLWYIHLILFLFTSHYIPFTSHHILSTLKSMSDTPQKDSPAKKSIKTLDTLVTGLLLWGVVASIYGIKKIHDKNHPKEHTAHTDVPTHEHIEKSEIVHTDTVPTPTKKSIWSRIFRGN
jgi:hypothetical protein